jgi:arylsulfatase A-like enzyme
VHSMRSLVERTSLGAAVSTGARCAAVLLCVAMLACRKAPETSSSDAPAGSSGARAADVAAAGPPFARTGATRDLLCDLDRVARGGAGGRCTCDDVPLSGRCGHVPVGLDKRRALLLDAGHKLTVPVDSGGAKFLRYAVGPPAPFAAKTTVRVTASNAAGERVAAGETVVGAGATWQEVSLAVPQPVAQVEVEVIAASANGKAEAALATPRFVTPSSRGAAGPTNVVVYLIDTLRADHTSAYGYARDTTPRLAALARDGIRFDLAYSTAARTRPATGSLLTGLMPQYHGAHSGFALSPQVATLAERFRDAGWSTWAFVTNGHVGGPGLNFDQGFDRFQYVRYPWRSHARTEEVNALLFPHLDAVADEPFLLYVHALDPHAPYDPPQGYTGRFTDPGYAGPVRPAETVTADLEKLPIGDADLKYIVGLYDEEIYYQDAMFGALLDRLDKLGVLDRTVIVVVADHGEEFQEHGAWAHGGRLFEEQTHVPLVVHVPRVAAFRGRTIAQPVQILDVMPTLLTWFGLPGAASCQGRDLTPLLTAAPGTEVAAAPIYAEETTYLPGAELKSLRMGDWKMIRSAADTNRYASAQVFDLRSDPRETTNVARKARRQLFELDGQMQRLERGWARDFRPEQGAKEELDEQTRKQLKALGYVE